MLRLAIVVKSRERAPKVFLGIRTIFIELDLLLRHSLEPFEEKGDRTLREHPEKTFELDPQGMRFVNNARKWKIEMVILDLKGTDRHVLEHVESIGLTVLPAPVTVDALLASKEQWLFILRNLTWARALRNRGYDVVLCLLPAQPVTEGKKLEGITVCTDGWQDIELLEMYS